MSESLDATATPSQSAKKRRRPALACTECRRRKMKCDQQKPCNNCSRPRRFLCIYPGESESTGPGTDLRGLTLTRRVSSIEPRHATVSSNTANRSTSRNRREYARLPTGNSSLREPVTPSSESVGSRGPVSASRSSDLQHKASSIATSDASNSNHVSGSPAIAHNSATKEHPRFERRFASQSSWVNNTTLHTRILRCLSQAQEKDPNLRKVMTQGKELSQRIIARSSATSDPSAALWLSPLTYTDTIDDLIIAYFENFEDVFRILHGPSFRAECRGDWVNPVEARGIIVLQLKVVLALGASARETPLVYGSKPSQWVQEVRMWMERSAGGPRRRPLTFEELQLHALLCLAEANGLTTERLSWLDAGDLLRKAMALDLHEDPSLLGFQEDAEAEMRRRLWATVLELNALLSLQSAQPPLISPANWTTKGPSEVADDELFRDHITTSRGASTAVDQMPGSAQSVLFSSFRLRLEVASKTSSTAADLPYNERLRLQSDLARAEAQMARQFSGPEPRSPDHESRRPQRAARIILARYMLALQLPLLGRSIKDPAFHFSRRTSIHTALKMLKWCDITPMFPTIQEPAIQEESILPGARQPVFVNSAGLFRGVAIQAVFAVLLELVTFSEEKIEGDGTLPAWEPREVREAALWCQEWIEMRGRKGLPDVPSCCFVAGCIAYAETLETGITSTQQIDDRMVAAGYERCKRYHELLEGAYRTLEECTADAITNGSGTQTQNGMDAAQEDDNWQADLGLGGGMDDFFGFDWSLLPDQGMFLDSI